MPRGGGHFGGHHHGGGGHHHGGGGHYHHHHHHHHRPYRSGIVFVGGWSGPGYYRRRSWIGFTVCWVVFFLIILAVILSTSLTTADDNKDDSDNKGFNTEYAPLETRLIDVSQTFCDGIELENPSHQMPSTAYVLSKGPSLTQEHDYEIRQNVTVGSNSYQYWNYYLNHGSSMNASICIHSGTAVEFYIIIGTKNFQDWQDGYDNYYKFMDIGSSCPQTISVNLDFVDKTDDYFFAYASLGGTVTFNTTMNFRRKEFGIVEEYVEHRCDAGGDYSKRCTVSVPYNDKHYFLLATGNTTSTEGDEDGAAVSWSCKSRVWVYILAFLVPALFGITVVTVICVVCCIRHSRRNSSYAKLDDDAATAAAVTNTSFVTTTTATTVAPPSEQPKNGPPPYSSATVPQGGYTGQTPYPPVPQAGQPPYPTTATYPSMPQPTAYPPVTQNYGATDNKPLH